MPALLIMGLRELESEFLECIEAGALGCLSVDASLEELHEHVRVIASGGALCSPQATKILFSLISDHACQREDPQVLNSTHLTRREQEIIGLIEEGLSNKEIATHLKIELQTVKNHVHNILEKLQLRNRREAAKYAREKRLMRGLERVPMVRAEGQNRPRRRLADLFLIPFGRCPPFRACLSLDVVPCILQGEGDQTP